MQQKIFISHSSVDTWVAKQIQSKLTKLGAATFLDEGCIDIGDDFENIIIKELRNSNELIVLLTPSALQRPYVWMEIGAAWAIDIRIIGMLYGVTFEEISTNSKTPVLIKKNNLVNLNDSDKYFEQLDKRLNELKS